MLSVDNMTWDDLFRMMPMFEKMEFAARMKNKQQRLQMKLTAILGRYEIENDSYLARIE